MAAEKKQVTGGVDTHSEKDHAAAVDQTGRVLGDHEFPATAAGYRALLAWLRSHGTVVRIGVEGTGTYGAGLARYLAAESIVLVEVGDRVNFAGFPTQRCATTWLGGGP